MEWYQNDPLLQKQEIKEILRAYPNAQMGVFADGRMYWIIKYHPNVCDVQNEWTLLLVYNSDYPKQQCYGSVKIYPVKPDYEEMRKKVLCSTVYPKNLPHVMRDYEGQIYLSVKNRNYLYKIPDIIYYGETAKAFVDMACLYIENFELALTDQQLWNKWNMTGNPDGGSSI